MDPVLTNIASQNCPEPISSNCITFAGPNPPGLCGPQSLTTIIQSLTNQVTSSSSCCTGTFPSGNSSCFTGKWIDFSANIVSSGGGENCTYSLSNVGTFASYSNAPNLVCDNPSYMWTPNGDLKFKGVLEIHMVTVGVPRTTGFTFVDMGTIASTCFPTGFTATQLTLAEVELRPSNTIQNDQVFLKAYLVVNYPTGLIQLLIEFDSPGEAHTLSISLCALTFNLA